jgi:hypothetical protein
MELHAHGDRLRRWRNAHPDSSCRSYRFHQFAKCDVFQSNGDGYGDQ